MKNVLNTIRKCTWNKWTRPLIILAIVVGLKNYKQRLVNQQHQSMDFARNIDDLHTRQLLDYIVVAGEFDNKYYRKAHENLGINPDIIDGLPNTKNIFLWAKNYPTIEEKKQAVERIRGEATGPTLIHTDFEGGYVQNIMSISEEEILRFGVPKEIIYLREEEKKQSGGNLSAFPSAEFLGKKYKYLFWNGTNQERLDFILMMQQYGKSIRKIMEYIGVDVVYGPNVDIVDDFDGKGDKDYMAKDDRSFGDNFIIGQDIISAFIDGYQSYENKTLLVPKHFVGTGKTGNPHEKTDSSNMNKDDGSIAVFKNIINGENPFLDEKYVKHCITVAKKSTGNEEYINILQKNIEFINFLNENGIKLSSGDKVGGLMTTHISGNKRVLGSGGVITYDEKILEILKTKIGQKNPLKNGIIFSDDLGMKGAIEGIKTLGIEDSEANRIIMALKAGHDVVLFLEGSLFGKDIDDILDEVAKMIDEGIDLDKDGRPDVTKKDIKEKAKKQMDLMVKNGKLTNIGNGKYQLKDATYFDPNLSKVFRDSRLSNQGLISGSGVEDYKKEGDGKKMIIEKKIKNLWSTVAHNLPNAIYKYIRSEETYENALKSGKKLIIVDKSEYTMFVYSIDGKDLLEKYKVGVGKGTDSLEYKNDRKVFGDNKTPVGYYMVINKVMGEQLYDHFDKSDIDEKGYYGGEKGGMLTLIGPRTPYIAIHGTIEQKIGPSSSACVRVLDEDELNGKSDISKQKLINHLAETIPIGSFVIITN